ncbi:MAG: glycine cleavage system aminomethyltransferase GcvT, partial [Sphingomonadales bacterium]|nr:glycine cleavage system aminomethyltransferase GcvT [Sphingomonadales bacterium]
MSDNNILNTPLYDLHLSLGAKMVPFAGYAMPVQYPLGVMGEHLHVREKAGLFDVSHMGQAFLRGTGAADIATSFESLVPGNIAGLKTGRMRYTMLLNDSGGILDDLMVTRWSGDNCLFLVVNAACKTQDFAHIEEKLAGVATLKRIEDRALIALQGPMAANILAEICPEVADMAFMSAIETDIDGVNCFVSRCGYTGEDGFEISIPNADTVKITEKLLAHPDVEPIGLGARDSLRLEAGLCLYGHDIDTTTSPVEGDLVWAIGKSRRENGGFPGADRVLAELENGTTRKRVGILPEGRAPAREHTEIQDMNGKTIGEITSGGFGPTFGGPVAMGYVASDHSAEGTAVQLI